MKDKHVIILIDEMHVREDLVYDKHSGQLIGFTNMGNINSQLTSMDESLGISTTPLANTMMTFMVRGLFSHLEFPYAYFPSKNVTGDLL